MVDVIVVNYDVCGGGGGAGLVIVVVKLLMDALAMTHIKG